MPLPDTLERIGIVVGSAFLLALPASALSTFLFGVGDAPAATPYIWVLPGLVVGLLVATDRLGVTYHAIWKFSLASYFAAFVGAGLLGLDAGTDDPALAVGWWLVSIAVGVLVARTDFRTALAGADR
ncbi:hypothetical protein [Halorussus halobius]|uniref:hypothetical protein n=1 Tax=Halorussus halobius TaxID=1710537 RepID=UPI00109282B8|nr:hypothetical protein [Halorussus halobius]